MQPRYFSIKIESRATNSRKRRQTTNSKAALEVTTLYCVYASRDRNQYQKNDRFAYYLIRGILADQHV